ncbi:hypothetical protein Csa_016077 [Cucumis sativus]|uniref:Uncharacterized protein n=1 Tax=Cucumis sativus TaxID=3659 RepID=A0A0A0K4Z8_CUCSA|nr:hypothetical protein Csa_016077 [Cucumis sativus]
MANKDEVLEVVVKEALDLENVPPEEVFETLRCNRNQRKEAIIRQMIAIEEMAASTISQALIFMTRS